MREVCGGAHKENSFIIIIIKRYKQIYKINLHPHQVITQTDFRQRHMPPLLAN